MSTTTDKPIIATIYNYKVGTTAALTDEQLARLQVFLSDLSRENGETKYSDGVIWGADGETPVRDFNPGSLREALGAS